MLRRLPRTLMESPAVFPDWRYQQAYLYDLAARSNQNYALLGDEDDQLTIQMYAYLRHGTSGSATVDRHIRYCLDAEDYNASFGAAARIKSYILADLSTEEIADRSGCAIETIETFEDLFFDLRNKRRYLDYIVSNIYPLVVPRNENSTTRRERFFMVTAWIFGIAGLDQLGRRTLDISEAAQKLIAQRLYALTHTGALNFQIAREARCNPQPEDHERMVSMMMVPKEETSQSEAKLVDFARGFASDVSSKLGIHLDPEKQVLSKTLEIGVRTREYRMRLTQGSDDPHVIDLGRLPERSDISAGNRSPFSIESY